MIKNRLTIIQPSQPEDEAHRRKREKIISVFIVFTVILLSFIEIRVVNFSGDFPISSTILMFILININLLLFLLLFFLVFRNLVKLYYDRKHRIMGAKLRTKLLAAFITLTLMPTTVLFFFQSISSPPALPSGSMPLSSKPWKMPSTWAGNSIRISNQTIHFIWSAWHTRSRHANY